MDSWYDRPKEIADLLNPAFCGEIIRRCIKSYQTAANNSMPYPLLYLILPIILHSTTRERIVPRMRQMHVWLENNPEIKIGFAQRASQLTIITNESIMFLIQVESMYLDDNANMIIPPCKHSRIASQEEGEVLECYKKAEIIGRLFAKAGTPTTIYSMWGVKP